MPKPKRLMNMTESSVGSAAPETPRAFSPSVAESMFALLSMLREGAMHAAHALRLAGRHVALKWVTSNGREAEGDQLARVHSSGEIERRQISRDRSLCFPLMH